MLEPSEKELGELLETARPAPPLSEGWEARAVAGMAAVAGTADRKETVPMRRLAYAMVILLVIGLAAAGVFTRSRAPNAKSLLISAAQAMEAARSVHIVGHATVPDSTSACGMKEAPEPYEMWFSASPRRVVSRFLDAGQLDSVLLVDLDANLERYHEDYYDEWFEADLTPVAAEAALVVAAMAEAGLSNTPIDSAQFLTDPQRSVQVERREGRDIAVITVTGTNTGLPRPLRERHVFEVDMETNHLLRSVRYAQAEGENERVLARVDRVDYDVAVPIDVPPAGAQVVQATAKVEETDDLRSLQLFAPDGELIVRSDVPR